MRTCLAAVSEGRVMDKMPLLAVVFQSIPEAIILFVLGLTLVGVPLQWKRIVVSAVILSFILYIVRGLPLPYGIHSIIGLAVMCALIMVFFRTSLKIAATAALLSGVVLTFIDVFYVPVIVFLTGMTIEQIWPNLVLRILLSLPELLILALITWYCVRKKFTLLSFSKATGEEKSTQEHDKK